MSSFLPGPTDTGGDVSPVTTPDQKALGKSHAQGNIDAGWAGHFWKVFFCAMIEGVKAILTALVGVFDELLSFFVQFVTAAQGTGAAGFYDLVAAIINDLLGVEIAGGEIASAGKERGLIPAMQKAGGALFNLLASEFTGAPIQGGGDSGGLPGIEGKPLTPEQGLAGAKAFLGFILSFAVREGNLNLIATALPENFRIFEGIREYGELMGKNLGLGRLSRRALQPLIQTLIATPLQQALNRQYRPHVMSEKQYATAFIRGDIEKADFLKALTLEGFSDANAELLISDTYTRMSLETAIVLHENAVITSEDLTKRVTALGFNATDTPLLIQARQLLLVQGADRKYAEILGEALLEGTISQGTYDAEFARLKIPKLEADALSRNAIARRIYHRAHLTLGFLKKAYLDATITIDEYLAHATELGYSQDDLDILEFELLLEQKQAADKVKAKAAAATAKAAKAAKGKVPPGTGG